MTNEKDVTIEMPEQDFEGNIEKFSVQTSSRIQLPEEWLESLGMEIGNGVAVVHEGDHIKVFSWDRENIQEILD